jgi:Na+-translocating ferredoxin:NAD+ oxidoreductase RnfG subunit
MEMMIGEIVIVLVAAAAIAAAVGGLVYMIVLSALQERDAHRHTQANALVRRATTSRQLPRPDARPARPYRAGRAEA